MRELLSQPDQDDSASADTIVAAGLLPVFVAFLSDTVHPMLQYEAAWALTNVASTHATRMVAQSGAVASLVPLLRSPSQDVRMQAAWCLGNIAGDGELRRDEVLNTPDAMQARARAKCFAVRQLTLPSEFLTESAKILPFFFPPKNPDLPEN